MRVITGFSDSDLSEIEAALYNRQDHLRKMRESEFRCEEPDLDILRLIDQEILHARSLIGIIARNLEAPLG